MSWYTVGNCWSLARLGWIVKYVFPGGLSIQAFTWIIYKQICMFTIYILWQLIWEFVVKLWCSYSVPTKTTRTKTSIHVLHPLWWQPMCSTEYIETKPKRGRTVRGLDHIKLQQHILSPHQYHCSSIWLRLAHAYRIKNRIYISPPLHVSHLVGCHPSVTSAWKNKGLDRSDSIRDIIHRHHLYIHTTTTTTTTVTLL